MKLVLIQITLKVSLTANAKEQLLPNVFRADYT